ncbi:MAG: SIS domain-containing protein [Elusimicrobiaceae bacterium]|nr:SIS domain-containing protein [Elusimicrobiaceae bacterium]
MKKDFTSPYFQEISHLLKRLEKTQTCVMEEAASRIAECMKKDGILHTFGCGHSASAALESFHRSGCFAAVDAVLDPGLMFQLGAQKGTDLERQEGYASRLLATHDLRVGDILLVFSNSGRNPAGIDAVLAAKQKGVFTIAFTAASAHINSKSRHSSGLLLKDVADLVIDNCVGQNETCLKVGDVAVAPISTIAFAAILHHVFYQVAVLLNQESLPLPVYKSSNAGGDSHNNILAAKYASRIKYLK